MLIVGTKIISMNIEPFIIGVMCGNKDLRASYVAGHAILNLGE